MRLALVVLLASVCVSLFFVVRLQPTSAGAFAFLAVWLAVPHGAMAALLIALLIALQRRGKPLLRWCVAAVLMAIGGLYVLADAIFWHTDAQGAIAVVLTPVLQGIAFAIAVPMAWWAGRRMRG